MKRYELIQFFIDKYKYKKYLEIGVRQKENFDNIQIDFKEGVDPDSNVKTTYNMSSDVFFEKFKNKKYDIIFVDGNHNGDFVYRDIKNSIKCLNSGGIIICHDCNPLSELFQLRVDHPLRKGIGSWNGTVWRAWVKLRSELDKNMFVVDSDQGLGVIKEGVQEKIDSSFCLMEYIDFRKDFKKILNLITIEQFFVNENLL